MGGAGAAAQVYAGAADNAVAQLCVFYGGDCEVVGTHVALLQIEVDTIPAVFLTQHHHTFTGVGGGEDGGIGRGLRAQIQSGGVDKANAVMERVLIRTVRVMARAMTRLENFIHYLRCWDQKSAKNYFPARARSSQTQPTSRAV